MSNSEWGIPQKEKDTFLSRVWEASSIDKVQLGIPAQVNLQFLVYNQSWASELGYSEIPATQDEFLTQVCEAARVNNQDSKRDNDGTGGWIINSTFPHTAFLDQLPLMAVKAWDPAIHGCDHPGLKPVMPSPTCANLTEKGCAWNSRVASPFTYFASRQALVIFSHIAGSAGIGKNPGVREELR